MWSAWAWVTSLPTLAEVMRPAGCDRAAR
jgi:hypothetical protein